MNSNRSVHSTFAGRTISAGSAIGRLSSRWWVCVMVWIGVGDVLAQRPFLQHDPFYRNEQTERSFFGGYAMTAEVAYRPAGAIQNDGFQGLDNNPFGLSFKVDYQVAQQLDISAIVDAAGNAIGRNLSLSWVVLKYYERSDEASFSMRLAVDPSFDGRSGFPQMDVAWLSSAPLTPHSSSNFALGIRRVRLGYEQWQFTQRTFDPEILPILSAGGLGDEQAAPVRNNVNFIYTRALGWEAHLMMAYNFSFDPAGSNIFFSLLGQAGTYDLIESIPESGSPVHELKINNNGEKTKTTDFFGSTIWIRSGLEFNRPGYQILPFIGLPIHQWYPSEGNWPRSQRQIGVRLMLR